MLYPPHQEIHTHITHTSNGCGPHVGGKTLPKPPLSCLNYSPRGTERSVISKQFYDSDLVDMKGLFVAFMFATILASTALISSNQQVSAQQGGATLIIGKIVEGLPPNSDWEFDLSLNVQPYSTVITIDKAGGETTIIFAVTQVQVSIVESTKSSYVVYLVDGALTTQTNVAFVGTGRLIDQDDTVTVAFINRNNQQPSSKPNYVGGVITPVNKLAVVAVYLALFGMIVASTGACLIKEKRNAHR